MDTEATIRRYIREITLYPELVDQLGNEESLFVNGILDSLGLVSMIAFLEEAFALVIPMEAVSIDRFSTLKGITSYIEQARS